MLASWYASLLNRIVRLRGLIAAPLSGDRERDRVAHVTNKLCVWPAGVAMFFFVIGLVFPSTGIRSDGVMLGVGAVFAVPFWLLRRGHTYVAAVLVLTLWWLGIGALACTSSGATAPAVIVYLVLIVASGLMGRTLFLWVTTLVCLFSLVALYALNQSGIVEPGHGVPNPFGRTLFLGALSLWLADLIRTTMAQLEAARRLSEQSEDRLVHANASLESRILERTRELSESKDAALAASRAKGEFLANMSHELRTPVSGMVGLADLLNDTTLSPEQRLLVTTLRQSGETLLAIVGDVLDFSKIEAGQLVLEEVEMDVEATVRGVVALLAASAHAKRLSLMLQIDPGVAPRVRGDSARLQQVLINLIGNAIKFTQKGGVTVRITWSGNNDDSPPRLGVFVEDTGIGVSTEALARVFLPFEQADSSTTRRFGGTGLGLAISRRLVKLMGGELQMESEEGKCTKLSFSIPLVACPPRLSVAASPVKPTRSLHVLVVEDSEVNAMVLTKMLKSLGHTTEHVLDGAQALERVRTHSFDVILMDMQMPVMGGEETTRRIRALPMPIAKVPIIGVSADTMVESQAQYLASGLTAYMVKPCRRNELAALLELAAEC